MRWLFAVLLCAFAVVGCDPATSETTSGPEVVRIGYFANLTHAQAVLGVASGEFEKAVAPAKLETRVFNAGPALIEALNAGEIDIAYVGPGPAISAHVRSRGDSIRVIAGAASNGVLVVARKDSGIRTLADLKGKRVATPQAGNTQDISARHFLNEATGDISGIVPVPNAEQRGMMERGQIDAAWAPEPWGSLLIAQVGATPVLEEKDLWPDKQFVLTVVATTPAFLQNHPDTVERVLVAHREWTRRLNESPDVHLPALSEALLKLTQKQLPPDVLKLAMGRTAFTDEPLPESLDAMNRWSHELGFSRQLGSLDGLIDRTILDRINQAPSK